ncbi:hypothetical protein F4859DRAFT_505513 [Xylaria cf. heliscus]|nr:hypothetical protein F4859DRAFT_505513 [Xylaria cf. heliscus]
MSNEYGTSYYSEILFGGQLASDELNSDFADMVDWGSVGPNLLDEDLPAPERHIKESSLIHAYPSANVHETQNGDTDTLATFTSLVLFANNPSVQHMELKACDSSRRATIQALAMKLNLHCILQVSSATVYLRKYSHEETISGLGQHIRRTFGESSDPVSTRFEDPMRGNTSDQSIQPSEACIPLTTHAPGSGQDLERHHSFHFSSHSDHPNGGNHGAFTKEPHLRGTEHVPFLSSSVPLQHGVNSRHDSCLSIPNSVESQSWRESFPTLSRTFKVIGACWRCKILRKKCDPDQPCKACPRAENKSRWQNIGCKRGNLLDHCPCVCLCPKIIAPGGRQAGQRLITSNLDSETSQKARTHLQEAFGRLEWIIDYADDTYMNVVLDILCSPLVDLNAIRLSREQNLETNLLVIAWTLVDSSSVKTILQVEHVDQTVDVMKAAITYEVEYGHSPTTALAIECLRHCVDILRLHEPGYLTPALHANCDPQQCRVESFQKLKSSIKAFIDEFSRVIFRKENRANERKWWLSAFYGLYIQSFVRRTIVFVEGQSLAHLRDSHPQLHRTCSDYLNLATELFRAASASYDPLMTTWSLEKEPIDHKFDVRLIKYYRLAQRALETNHWAEKNIETSFEFISFSFGEDPSVRRGEQNESGMFPNLPLRPMLRRNSTESQTRRFSSGMPIDRDVIYENETGSRVFSPARDASLLQKLNGKGLSRLRRGSGTKRRASSPPQSDGSLLRNDSSSSMLNVTAMRRRGPSLATPSSPLSPYLGAYDSTPSLRWNGSEDSLSNLPQLLSPDTPALPRSQELNSSRSLRTPSLHNKSSNESFLEMPGILNHKRSRGNLARAKLSQETFLCECCPKKPKAFDNAAALSAHEREKQYECSYCGNRFKTKNESERHQNSLHIRRQSWSCSELLGANYVHTFRRNLAQAGDDATCCYCGINITETNAENGNIATEGIWDARLKHLKDAHKFGECNTFKKFYRADHFRQHLRHSHAAILGDGTSHLEASCMKEVTPPMAITHVR